MGYLNGSRLGAPNKSEVIDIIYSTSNLKGDAHERYPGWFEKISSAPSVDLLKEIVTIFLLVASSSEKIKDYLVAASRG